MFYHYVWSFICLIKLISVNQPLLFFQVGQGNPSRELKSPSTNKK